ncbi:hypothetical protein [Streptomyces sp. NPDC096032]|uniref:hypothetical protein n=1 Tax=Streptomyces sp. NPDC096032 TaxID=3366070 RepID=UPI003818B45B
MPAAVQEPCSSGTRRARTHSGGRRHVGTVAPAASVLADIDAADGGHLAPWARQGTPVALARRRLWAW